MILLAGLLVAPGRATADWGMAGSVAYGPAVDASVFYDALSPYGDWVSVPGWGWCWRPLDVPPGWRPYTEGHWDYTDLGYTWVSDYDWGWAPFHYGRWAYDPFYGWLWIPGYEWAPAWVAWRWSDDWCGWAPLPPGVAWSASFGLTFERGFDLDRVVPTQGWCFVRSRDLFAPRVEGRLVPAARNLTLLPETREVTRFASLRGRPVVRGPDVGRLERLTGHIVPRYHVTDWRGAFPAGGMRESGRTLAIYRPVVRAARPGASPAPRAMTARGPRIIERGAPSGERRYDSWLAGQRRQLDHIQREERSRPPAGLGQEELQRRQELERSALESQARQERQVMSNLRRQEAPPAARGSEWRGPSRAPASQPYAGQAGRGGYAPSREGGSGGNPHGGGGDRGGDRGGGGRGGDHGGGGRGGDHGGGGRRGRG